MQQVRGRQARPRSHKGKKRSTESILKGVESKKRNGNNICKEETKLKLSNRSKGIPKPMSQKQKDSLKCHENNKIKITCPHCFKIGQLTNMKAWHFDKCKFSPNYISDDIICYHCGIKGPKRSIKRYHNDNCKLRP